ncbi:hypothetical protein E0W68_02610 [Flavobacterium salilacus subsp. salilacus]|uniref:hypothetical protein n=1 Tax=Flavobacterium TaxID=237 RepID=UPI001074D79E|nr:MULTISPECIES: hypothetical protein [Flavobacterium]KAF2520134.1 hypothetical protein E0W68_02610 [Flavobacterium salilacus subsp. salilacus]MBE1613950.1 hypothetical protein [Flavobacterium sp. SaA2.13]
MKKLLLFFSYAFNPLLIPLYATLFYFLVTQNYFYKHEIYLVFIQVLILTMLLPISLFYLLRSLGLIRTKMLIDKKERKLPLAFYAVLLLVLIKHSFSVLVIHELYYYFLGSLISIMIALTLILFKQKISLHVMGISSLTVFVISISAYYHISFLYLIAFLILSSGLVASSRLQEKEHSLSGIFLGSIAGILPQVLLWFVWLL